MLNEPVECIVNAANEKLQHNGGIAAHIHWYSVVVAVANQQPTTNNKVFVDTFAEIARKAHTKLLDECAAIIAEQQRVVTGTSVITSAGNINPPIYHVIHAVGPVYVDGKSGEDMLLAAAVKSVLVLATQYHIKSISIPAISAKVSNNGDGDDDNNDYYCL